jgi:transposase-like protein
MFYKGEHMPTKEISPSREGRDQRSDSPTKDIAGSNRGVRDFATRSETHQYATRDDLSQQGVGEQAYEQELARKGKKLAIPDETSWHSDTSSSGYSSGSDSEMSASLDTNRPEKLVLTDKSGLLGGMDAWGGIAGATGAGWREGANREGRDLEKLLCCLIKMGKRSRKRKEAKNLQEQRIDHLAKLDATRARLQELTFDVWIREHPDLIEDASLEDFKAFKSQSIQEIDREIDITNRSSLQDWKENIRQYKESHARYSGQEARYSDQGASSSRQKRVSRTAKIIEGVIACSVGGLLGLAVQNNVPVERYIVKNYDIICLAGGLLGLTAWYGLCGKHRGKCVQGTYDAIGRGCQGFREWRQQRTAEHPIRPDNGAPTHRPDDGVYTTSLPNPYMPSERMGYH